MKERIAYWDYLRGIAILMVVSIHCYPYDQTIIHGHIFPTFIRAFVNICVPLFLAISGYFACKKNLDSLFLYKSFIKKQLLRVYFPCIIISIPIAVFKILKGGDIVGEAIRLFICQSFSIYYFIFLIIQFYLLTPILKKIVDKPIAAGGVLIVNIAALFVLQYILTIDFDFKLFVFRVGLFVYWIAFYTLGVYLSQSKRDYNLTLPFLITIIGFLLQIVETYCFGIEIGLPVSITIYSCGAIIVLFSNKIQNVLERYKRHFFWLSKIGRYSFVIYLIHFYVIMVLNHFVIINNWFANWFLICVISYYVVWLLDKYIPKRIKLYIGLK